MGALMGRVKKRIELLQARRSTCPPAHTTPLLAILLIALRGGGAQDAVSRLDPSRAPWTLRTPASHQNSTLPDPAVACWASTCPVISLGGAEQQQATLPWRLKDLDAALAVHNPRQFGCDLTRVRLHPARLPPGAAPEQSAPRSVHPRRPMLRKLHGGQPITALAYGSSVTHSQVCRRLSFLGSTSSSRLPSWGVPEIMQNDLVTC